MRSICFCCPRRCPFKPDAQGTFPQSLAIHMALLHVRSACLLSITSQLRAAPAVMYMLAPSARNGVGATFFWSMCSHAPRVLGILALDTG